jgi:hypothetical protein
MTMHNDNTGRSIFGGLTMQLSLLTVAVVILLFFAAKYIW